MKLKPFQISLLPVEEGFLNYAVKGAAGTYVDVVFARSQSRAA